MLGCKIVVQIWLPPNVLARFWTSNHGDTISAQAPQRRICKTNSPLFTLRVSMMLLRLNSNKEAKRKGVRLDSNSAYFEPYGSRHELLRNSTLFLTSLGAGCRGRGQQGKGANNFEPLLTRQNILFQAVKTLRFYYRDPKNSKVSVVILIYRRLVRNHNRIGVIQSIICLRKPFFRDLIERLLLCISA